MNNLKLLTIVTSLLIFNACSFRPSNDVAQDLSNNNLSEDLELIEPVEESFPLVDVKNPEQFVKYYLRSKLSLYNAKTLKQVAQNNYKLAQENPKNPELQEQAFLLLLANQDYAKALNIVNNTKEDISFKTLFVLSQQVAQEDFANAQKTLNTILRKQTRLPHLKILHAFFEYDSLQDIDLLEKTILEINSSIALDGFKYYYIARAYENYGDFEKAFDYYSKAFFNNGLRTAEVFSRLIYVANKLNSTDKYKELFESNSKYGKGIYLVDQTFVNIDSVKELDPSLKAVVSQVFYDLGWSVIQTSSNLAGLNFLSLADYITPSDKNKYQLAIGFINNSWELDGINLLKNINKESDLYISAKLLLINQLKTKDLEQALELVKTLQQNTKLSQTYIDTLLGELYLNNEKYQKAIFYLSKVLEKESSAKIYFSRAVAYERTGQFPKAIKDLRIAIQKNPKNPIIRNYLGYLLVDLQIDQKQGIEHIIESIKLDPTNASSIDSLGWAYIKTGEYEKALKALEKAYMLNSEDGIITGHLADAYLHNGRKTEAIIYWKKALELEKKDLREINRIKQQLEKYNTSN